MFQRNNLTFSVILKSAATLLLDYHIGFVFIFAQFAGDLLSNGIFAYEQNNATPHTNKESLA